MQLFNGWGIMSMQKVPCMSLRGSLLGNAPAYYEEHEQCRPI